MPNPWYTAAGNDAGANGNVAASSDATKTDRQFVDQWITAPFHAAGILDPDARDLGLRLVPAGRRDAVPRRGNARRAPRPDRRRTDDRHGVPRRQLDVADRAADVPRRRVSRPAVSVPGGYNPTVSTGTPLFALLPSAPDPASTLAATVERDGVAVESCAYDETSYTNPDANAQALGRQVLATRHQVVVIPKLPLVQGSVYSVSISVTYAGELTPTVTSWSFTADSLPPPPPAVPTVSIGNASVVEGNARARQLKLTVSLSKPWTRPVQVAYATAAHTATAGIGLRRPSPAR